MRPHPSYSHLLEDGSFNLPLIKSRTVRAARGWMNFQARSPLAAGSFRSYPDTLRANLRNEMSRAEMQRGSFELRQAAEREAA